jgi:hypothetical protein
VTPAIQVAPTPVAKTSTSKGVARPDTLTNFAAG